MHCVYLFTRVCVWDNVIESVSQCISFAAALMTADHGIYSIRSLFLIIKKKTAGRALCYSNGRIALPVHFIRAELRLGFTEYTYFIIFIIRTLTV